MQCCTCSKWVHLKCSLLSFSRFRTLGRSYSCSYPPCCIPASSGNPIPTNTVTSSKDSSSLYTTVAQPGPPSANASLPPHPRLQTFYSTFVHFVFSPSAPSPPPRAPGCFSTPPASSSPLTPSGFFNGMLEVSESGTLNFYNLFCLIRLILLVSRNLTLTYFPLSGFLDSLLCDLIVFFVLFAIFILHSRESELYRYTLNGKSALSWELPFSRFMGHLSAT